jgi:hypothetical protein
MFLHCDPRKAKEESLASSDDAGFFEAEIAVPAESRHSNDDVIHQMELQNCAGFENSPGKAHIRLGRGGIAGLRMNDPG